MLYSIIHFRAAPDDDSDGPPIHGHTGLEIVWTLIPTVLVTAIGIVSAIVLGRRTTRSAQNVLRVNVTAQQFAWSFSYPDAKGLTSGTLRLPNGRSVAAVAPRRRTSSTRSGCRSSGRSRTRCRASTTTLHITPTEDRHVPVICTELCGLGHAVMRTTAIVMTPAASTSG